VFDVTAAATGQNEKTLIKNGLVKGRDYETLLITQNSHASYYPGAVPMVIKLIFSMDGKKIYGAQAVGGDAVDKRIDTIAVTIRLGGTVSDLESLELAYAPPYSSAKDPVNMAGFVAGNVLSGKVAFASWDTDVAKVVALDVREQAEIEAYALPKYTHIPLGQLRKRLGELDKNSEIVVFCAIGVRAYNGARILMENGFKNVKVYPGGARLYQSMHYQESGIVPMSTAPVADSGDMKKSAGKPAEQIDCTGKPCKN
jgi:rhodanese-related sulfurtransferase